MQVLVALARAHGAVVSRDELIRQCWGGRIVGDDAINRCVSKVRQLSELGGGKAFEIETIPRVGYRLKQSQPVAGGLISAAADTSDAPPKLRSWRWLAIGLAAAIVAIAASVIAARYLYPSREPEWTVAESHLPFISTADIESYPAIAPDGTMIAYSAGPDRRSRHIYLRLLKGGDPIQLTHDAYDAAAPAWSPDGRIIAYMIFQPNHPCRILEITVPAGQSREVGRCRVNRWSSLSFDPSGRSVFYVDAPAPGANERIFKLDLDNGRVSTVTHLGRGSLSDPPTVSPDGSTLLYTRIAEADRIEVRVLTLANGVDRLIGAFDSVDNVVAAWSTDGQTIFLARSDSGDKSLWAYPLAGSDPRRILTTGDSIGRLSAGPNGLLALEMVYPDEQLVAVTPHSGLPPKPIPSGGLRTQCVDYAPDGTFLATGRRAETWGVWIGGTNGSLPELLTTSDSPWAIRWSPDGTRFAFIEYWHGHGFQVRALKREGEPIAQFRYPGNDGGLLEWTANGKSILTSRQETKGWRIWRTDLATPDKSVPITPYGWRDPRVHGSMLFAARVGVAGIWRIDGTPRRMTDGPAPEASEVYNIAGDRLIYADTSDPEHPVFSAVSVNGGPKDRLAPLPHAPLYYTFGVDPKSGDIAYSQETDDTDIGLLRLVKR
jgi:Tol biopolymer transport system component